MVVGRKKGPCSSSTHPTTNQPTDPVHIYKQELVFFFFLAFSYIILPLLMNDRPGSGSRSWAMTMVIPSLHSRTR